MQARIIATSPAQDFSPVRTLEIDIGAPLAGLTALDVTTGRSYRQAAALVRLHSQPLGVVPLTFDERGIEPGELARQLWAGLAETIAAHLRADGLPEAATLTENGLPAATVSHRCQEARTRACLDAPFVSVVVPTHDRPQHIRDCLASLSALDYPRYEIIVVDNAPSTPEGAERVQQLCTATPYARYVREDRPGACWARNRGLLEARGEIVAFTDDDVVVDRHWLAETVQAFQSEDHVGCVTGNILARELETPAQLWFERRGGFSRGFKRRVYDLGAHRPDMPLYPYAAMMFGSGNSMAFRTSLLRQLGGFDPALDITSPAMGGEDLAAFFEVIVSGHALVYEPAVLGHHLHRREYEGLRRQIHAWGVGFTAFLTRALWKHPGRIADFLSRLPHALAVLVRGNVPYARTVSEQFAYCFPPGKSQELRAAEFRGYWGGLLAYLRGRRHVQRIVRRFGPLPAMPAGQAPDDGSAGQRKSPDAVPVQPRGEGR